MADSVAKKLETSVIGPGLTALEVKNASTEGRGGRVMVGRGGGGDVSAEEGVVVDMFLGFLRRFLVVGEIVRMNEDKKKKEKENEKKKKTIM